jgi:hypothetical protein
MVDNIPSGKDLFGISIPISSLKKTDENRDPKIDT